MTMSCRRKTMVPVALLSIAVFANAAQGQCTPIVTGEYQARAGLGGAIEPISPEIIDLVIALAEQCGELSIEFLRVQATYDFDDGSNTLSFNSELGIKDFINTSATKVTDFFQLPNPLKPDFQVVPCVIVEEKPITDLGGNWGLTTISIGSGPNTIQASATFTICDELEVVTPVATTVELPLRLAGSVLAAESFGDPDVTRGYAQLMLSGSMAGASVGPFVAEVESVSVIPEQESIDVSEVLLVDVAAGRTVFEMSVTGSATAEATALCTGLFCIITGAATAGIDFPGSIEIGNFTGPDGGPLPEGTRVTSLLTGATYVGAVACVEDINGNGNVDFGDVLAILAAWGNAGGPEDIDGSGFVDFGDILAVLAAWGPCP